ncbi:hypothetical protein FRD53_21550, partial [Mycobacterium tuberculosis]
TTLNARDQPPAEVSDQRVSGLTGAVQVRWLLDRASLIASLCVLPVVCVSVRRANHAASAISVPRASAASWRRQRCCLAVAPGSRRYRSAPRRPRMSEVAARNAPRSA